MDPEGPLPVLDEHGAAALCCAAGGTALTPAPEPSGALECARCGHRTDLPGAGVLGDAAGDGHDSIGDTVDVTVRGDTAYSRSLGLPLLLLGLGLPFLALVGFSLRDVVRQRRAGGRSGISGAGPSSG